MELMKTILFIPCVGTNDIIQRDKIMNNDRLDLMTSISVFLNIIFFNICIDMNLIH